MQVCNALEKVTTCLRIQQPLHIHALALRVWQPTTQHSTALPVGGFPWSERNVILYDERWRGFCKLEHPFPWFQRWHTAGKSWWPRRIHIVYSSVVGTLMKHGFGLESALFLTIRQALSSEQHFCAVNLAHHSARVAPATVDSVYFTLASRQTTEWQNRPTDGRWMRCSRHFAPAAVRLCLSSDGQANSLPLIPLASQRKCLSIS